MAHIPDKPTARRHRGALGRALGGRRHLPLRPHRRPRPRSSRSTRRRRPCQRLAARRPRVQLHPHRHRRPLPADARQATSSTRWAGTTTACPPSAGCRTTTASAATRRCPTTPTSSRRPKRRPEGPPRCRSAGPTSSSCASGSPPTTRTPSRSCSAASACRSTGDYLYTTIGDAAGRTSQAAFLRNLARGEAYQRRGARRCGTSTSAPPSPRPSWRTASGPAPTTARLPRPTATATSSSTRPGPSCSPRCVALVAHPDDERYQPLFGTTVRTPLFDVEVPVVAHQLAEPDKGTGIAMICTFGDITDVTWWRELDLPTRARRRPRRPARRRPTPDVDHGRRRPSRATPSWPARRSSRPRRAIVELLARDGRAARRAAPDHAPGEVLREGRPAARDRHQPPVVHPQRRPRRRTCATTFLARGERAALAPRPHAPPLRATGSRGSTATG